MARRVKKHTPKTPLELLRSIRKPPVRPTQSIPSKKARLARKPARPTKDDE